MQFEESGGQSRRHMDWLEPQRAIYAAMHNDRKRKFPDLTADAMHGAGLLDVYESIE